MHTDYKDERGYIVVETVGTFVPLVLLIISILSLVNIVAVQARMHFALTQAAITISVLSYSLETDSLQEAESIFSDINAVFNNVSSLGFDNAENIFGNVSSNFVVDGLVYMLVERYLANGNMSGSEFMKRFGVNNLDFGSSVLIDENENIKLIVHYEIEYAFGALPLPFNPSLKVTQTAVTKAWLSGSGTGTGVR